MITKKILVQRAEIVQQIRKFFIDNFFLEVTTPQLVPIPSSEPYLEFFETELLLLNGKKQRSFLTSSPEYAMKKLLSQNMGNIFQICKSYRNLEEVSDQHNPEFTILEWYRTQANYFDLMDDTENLIVNLVNNLSFTKKDCVFSYQNNVFDLTPPFLRLTVAEAFQQYAQISEKVLLTNQLIQVAQSKGYEINNQTTWEQAYHQIFLNEIEPKFKKLTRPVFLYKYPGKLAALAKLDPQDNNYAQRFELYFGDLEIANAFSELIDAQEQKQRCLTDLKYRKQMGKKQYLIDEEFIKALEKGVPECAGIALGVDRLVMFLTNQSSISDVMTFPAQDMFK